MLKKARCTIMRGGTTKGVFLRAEDLPVTGSERDRAIMNIFGSGDPFQIDGIGGGKQYTSKVIIVNARNTTEKHDLDFEFGQVGIQDRHIDWNGIDGNLISALGPYAIEEGIVEPHSEVTTVRVFSRRFGKSIEVDVPVQDGQPIYDEEYNIDGVTGKGAKIICRWLEPGGSLVGHGIFPSGNHIDRIKVGGNQVKVSIIDCGALVAIFKAHDFGLDGTELPGSVAEDILNKIKQLRMKAAELSGIVGSWEEADKNSPLFPLPAMVCKSKDYTTSDGKFIDAGSYNILVRIFSLGEIHHALSVSGAIAVGSSAFLPGTVTESSSMIGRSAITLGHPKGLLKMNVETTTSNGKINVSQVIVSRTCRLIMQGYVYYNA